MKKLIILVIIALFVSACTSTTTDESVAATFFPLYDLTKKVTGDTVNVFSVVPPGADPHFFEAGAQDIRRVSQAQAFVTLGVEFERFEEILQNSVSENTIIIPAGQGIHTLSGEYSHGDEHNDNHSHDEHHEHENTIHFHASENKIEYDVTVTLPTPCHEVQEMIRYDDDELIIDLTIVQPSEDTVCIQVIDLREVENEIVLTQDVHEVIINFEGERLLKKHLDEHNGDEHEHNHEHGHDHHHETDPHIWLSPNNAIRMLNTIEAGLVEAFPEHQEVFQANAQVAREELQALEQEFSEGLFSCEQDTILVAHNAYQYLARDYDFNIISISGLSHEQEPSPRQLQQLIDTAQEHNIQIVFFEELASPRVSETIANQIGAQVRLLDPVESGTNDYLTAMRLNLENLREAMNCQ